MNKTRVILSPDDANLPRLTERLSKLAQKNGQRVRWPKEGLRRMADAGVFSWFVPREFGGQGWSEQDLLRGFVGLAAADLTATFVLTQWVAACRRILVGDSSDSRMALGKSLAKGEHLTTVAISHLTTSRQHLGQPVLRVAETGSGRRLQGYSPWVTGAARAQSLVVGAVCSDGGQLLVYVPTKTTGIRVDRPAQLVGLGGSLTGRVDFENVEFGNESVIAGPSENVLLGPASTGSGGLQTTALALGLSLAAIRYLFQEGMGRSELVEPAEQLAGERNTLESEMLRTACGAGPSANELRMRANSLVLRATQAALVAAKGAGFVESHPVGRWCREALFFLVWSCPQPVANANLCELAGLASD